MDAYNKYQAACEAYRARTIGDDEYLAARKEYFDHLAALDASPGVWRDEDCRVSCGLCVSGADEGTTFVLLSAVEARSFQADCAMTTGPVTCGYCGCTIPRAA